jgi:hypothetical protein
MTGWHIRAGYSSRVDASDVESMLKTVVAEVRADIDALRREHGIPDTDVLACFQAMASGDDQSLTERTDNTGRYECMLLASGGGSWRLSKEQARRTFVRLVMRRMHAVNLDISVTVA